MRLHSGALAIAVLLPVIQAYDYVIIGGGTAGLTVAGRLSEDPNVTVAVIEAGVDAESLPEVFIPGMIGQGESLTTLNWAYPTVPQQNLNGRTLTIDAGKALGGSSVINSMIFPRAEKEQYDVWAQLNNDTSWGWDGLLTYFKKSENATAPNDFQITVGGVTFDPQVHGFGGNVQVGFPNYFYNQSTLWRNASESLGFHLSPDLSDGDLASAVGVSSNSIDPVNNTRCSAACAYYTPVASRPNLTVLLNTTVSRIIWATRIFGNGPITASAVEYIQGDQKFIVSVDREAIVSAGTIATPKILELSGVGNSTILSAARVNTVLNLSSVGENLADHVQSWANVFSNNILTKDQLYLNQTYAQEQLGLWFTNRTGAYSAAPRSLGIAAPTNIFNSSQLQLLINQARNTTQETAIEFSNGNPNLAKGIQAQLDIALNLYEQGKGLPLELNLEPGYSGLTPFGIRLNRTYTSIHSVLLTPLSRGRLHISSSDPLAPPDVDPNYWGHPMDIAIQVAGIKIARLMLTTPPMDTINDGEFEPGVMYQTDEQIQEWLRGVVASDNHCTGTAAMLPEDLGGVVDTTLTVYGTSNVRVVDASIVPFPLSAHIASTVYAIAEKAADMIKASASNVSASNTSTSSTSTLNTSALPTSTLNTLALDTPGVDVIVTISIDA